MASSSIKITTTPVTREKLARALGGNQQLIRLLEGIVQDVTVNIPTGTDTLQALAEDTDATVNLVQAMAATALAMASQMGDGPPMLPSLTQEIPDDMTARISAIESRLSAIEQLIAELREGPST